MPLAFPLSILDCVGCKADASMAKTKAAEWVMVDLVWAIAEGLKHGAISQARSRIWVDKSSKTHHAFDGRLVGFPLLLHQIDH
jgi:hypothetical protein